MCNGGAAQDDDVFIIELLRIARIIVTAGNDRLIVDDDDFVVHLSGPVRRWVNQRPGLAQIRLPAVFAARLSVVEDAAHPDSPADQFRQLERKVVIRKGECHDIHTFL